MKYVATILTISVHPENENPLYGDNATHVVLEDEGGGPFVVIRQHSDAVKEGEIRLDFPDAMHVMDAIKRLRSQPAVSV